MYCVGDETFRTQAQILQRLRELTQDTSTVLMPANQTFAIAAVSMYSKVTATGMQVRRVYVARNAETPAFSELCLHVEMEDGVTVLTVAAAKVARAASSPEAAAACEKRRSIDRALERLREAVLPQIQAFKVAAFEHGEGCAMCSANLPESRTAHVDHTGELEFRHLVATLVGEGDIRRANSDRFSGFHRKHASLQLLCAKCNLSKKRKRP